MFAMHSVSGSQMKVGYGSPLKRVDSALHHNVGQALSHTQLRVILQEGILFIDKKGEPYMLSFHFTYRKYYSLRP